MKKVLILLSLIYFSFCSLEECGGYTVQEKCNEIDLGQNGLFCFKANITNEYLEDEDNMNMKVMKKKKKLNVCPFLQKLKIRNYFFKFIMAF